MPWKNQGGGPWGSGPKGPWGQGPQSVGPRPPDLEDLLRRGQDKIQQILPGGYFSGMGIALLLFAALAIWGLSGFFRVQSEELGVVLRFGKHVRTVQPGLNYHLPYPIETVLLPKALRVSTISIGMTLIEDPARRGRTMRDVPEESLMLTGDENIVDVDFTVLWRIKPKGVADYLFNIQNPEGTVKAVAESAMREVIGRSQIQPILTGARQTIEGGVQDLMQRTLDHYGAGVQITQVQLQKVDPPAGHRCVPRRAGGPHRRRARPERGADLRQSRGAGSTGAGGADHPGGRSLSGADGGRGHRPGVAVPEDLRPVQERPGGDAPAHVSGDHGAA